MTALYHSGFGPTEYNHPVNPKTFGRFEVKSELGKGSMATVYEAADPATGEKAAVKVFAPDKSLTPSQLAELRARFERESRVLLSVDHPNVVKVFEAGVADGSEYIAMEFLDGFNLKELMEMGTVFKYADALDIVSQVGMGLMACHRAGVVHRDIKPANIVKLLTGGIKITDFGIARLTTDATLAQADTRVGTPNYMSPEQIQGLPVDERSDVFSLGVVMYEMLTRHKPFEGDTITTIMYNVTHVQPPTPLFYDPNLPRATEKVIFKALAKDRALRYQTMQGFVDDVQDLMRYTKTGTVQPGATAADVAATVQATMAAKVRGSVLAGTGTVYCVDCGMANSADADDCVRCKQPLLKRDYDRPPPPAPASRSPERVTYIILNTIFVLIVILLAYLLVKSS
jgi:serine/threonine-protein kinase